MIRTPSKSRMDQAGSESDLYIMDVLFPSNIEPRKILVLFFP